MNKLMFASSRASWKTSEVRRSRRSGVAAVHFPAKQRNQAIQVDLKESFVECRILASLGERDSRAIISNMYQSCGLC